ncbi:MAG: hypothetical protein AAFV80_09625 [Bacteroidota bacterium]
MYGLKKWLATRMIAKSRKQPALPIETLETKQHNPDLEHFNDSSYFFGRHEDGSFMVVRQSFRTSKPTEHWLNLRIPEKGTFILYESPGPEGDGFQQGSLKFTCVEINKKWHVAYDGHMTDDKGESRQVKIDLNFEALHPMVDFSRISSPETTGALIAKEKWSKEFFAKVKEIRKQHIEQGGYLTGTITIDGEVLSVNWRSIRDHSFGVRSWAKWGRHMWLGGVLDDGRVFNVSAINYDFLGTLSAGFLTDKSGGFSPVKVTKTFDDFATDPLIPNRFNFDMTTEDGKTHQIEVNIPDNFDFVMDGAYRIFEGAGVYKLDGIAGLGISEFGFNISKYGERNLD